MSKCILLQLCAQSHSSILIKNPPRIVLHLHSGKVRLIPVRLWRKLELARTYYQNKQRSRDAGVHRWQRFSVMSWFSWHLFYVSKTWKCIFKRACPRGLFHSLTNLSTISTLPLSISLLCENFDVDVAQFTWLDNLFRFFGNFECSLRDVTKGRTTEKRKCHRNYLGPGERDDEQRKEINENMKWFISFIR